MTSLSRSTKLAQIEWNEPGNRLAATTTDGNLLVYHFDENSSSSQSSSALVHLHLFSSSLYCSLDARLANDQKRGTYECRQLHGMAAARRHYRHDEQRQVGEDMGCTTEETHHRSYNKRCVELYKSCLYVHFLTAANFTLSWSQCANYLFYGDRESVISVVDMRNQQVIFCSSSRLILSVEGSEHGGDWRQRRRHRRHLLDNSLQRRSFAVCSDRTWLHASVQVSIQLETLL